MGFPPSIYPFEPFNPPLCILRGYHPDTVSSYDHYLDPLWRPYMSQFEVLTITHPIGHILLKHFFLMNLTTYDQLCTLGSGAFRRPMCDPIRVDAFLQFGFFRDCGVLIETREQRCEVLPFWKYCQEPQMSQKMLLLLLLLVASSCNTECPRWFFV